MNLASCVAIFFFFLFFFQFYIIYFFSLFLFSINPLLLVHSRNRVFTRQDKKKNWKPSLSSRSVFLSFFFPFSRFFFSFKRFSFTTFSRFFTTICIFLFHVLRTYRLLHITQTFRRFRHARQKFFEICFFHGRGESFVWRGKDYFVREAELKSELNVCFLNRWNE